MTRATYGENMRDFDHRKDVYDMKNRLRIAYKKFKNCGDDVDLKDCLRDIVLEDEEDYYSLLNNEIFESEMFHQILRENRRQTTCL